MLNHLSSAMSSRKPNSTGFRVSSSLQIGNYGFIWSEQSVRCLEVPADVNIWAQLLLGACKNSCRRFLLFPCFFTG